jgi:lysozyme
MKPKKKPENGFIWFNSIIEQYKKDIGQDAVFLIGVRGYYRDLMGKKGVNDRGIYDDALVWINLKTGFIATYNGNCDPSAYRIGKGSGSEKGMAMLKPGAYRYKPGLHRGYEAFRQAGPVNIWRDGTNGQYDDVLQSSINIHRGGINGTSSLGCQTLPVDQWDDFKKTGYNLIKQAGQKTFCYILVEKQG